MFIDLSWTLQPSYGGTQYWLLVMDDCTGYVWSFLLHTKAELADTVLALRRRLKQQGITVKYIRCDNAGENNSLQDAIGKHPTLKVTFEYSPRDSPQYNGKVERRFQFLWNGVRSVLNAAKLPEWLRHGLWAEAGNFVQQVADQLVTSTKKQEGSSYQQFQYPRRSCSV